jgi:hypothetical protein
MRAAINAKSIFPSRFLSKVNVTDECWIWTGAKTCGYGSYRVDGRAELAHRFAYMAYLRAFEGREIRPNANVCHDCPGGDNPACVNPAHLFEGSQADNLADMRAKGRHARGDSHGRRRLNSDTVRAIRADTGSDGDLAVKYHASDTTIRDIRRRKTWRHI